MTDPYYSEGGIDSIGAVYLYNGSTNVLISVLKGSSKNDWVGISITSLYNSNYIVSSPKWNNNAGAATWCSGTVGFSGNINATNSLVGSSINDSIGYSVTILTNGNYVVNSPNWNNKTGAVTWGNGKTGVSGIVSSSNSLVGSSSTDLIGNLGITTLNNGNYVICSPFWNDKVGAATWGNGSNGTTGTVNATNSLVGANMNDSVGYKITTLTNGNYVVISPKWNNKIGAATWGNGTTGLIGTVNSTNSLIGSNPNDFQDCIIQSLTNGNYVVTNYTWNSFTGAVTWGNGTTGVTGTISSSNSLVGSIAGDLVGFKCIPLTNGNYVIASYRWNSAYGAATWGNGNTGIIGTISAANSLIGTSSSDQVGSHLIALTNGNYVTTSEYWNGTTGAATWGNGSIGIKGNISSSNSLIGSTTGDRVGTNVIALPNNNYVVGSYMWSGSKGAATWCNGNTGKVGLVTSSNSLVGNGSFDQVGTYLVALTNGNYVIGAPYWNTYMGAATWGNGSIGQTGIVGITNSFVGTISGSSNGDLVSRAFIYPLSNGNYVVRNRSWDGSRTSTTWGDGTKGTKGAISATNSLMITPASSSIYGYNLDSTTDGNYIVFNYNWNGGNGAVTWCNGTGGTVGTPNSCNSVFGTAATGGRDMVYAYNSIYNYLLVGRPLENIVSRFYPALGTASPSNNDNSSATISGNSPFIFPTTTGCGQIAALTPSGTNPVSGSVTAKTWIESPQPTYFVARHYEITPTTNPTTSTGTITLYFTQADFDGFNNQSIAPASKLPTAPNDAVGISHLLVQKEGGVSNVGTGLPGTYPGAVTTINPDDANIVWNTALQRWEVTFYVIGFSGFFIKTATTAVVLPLQLLNFSGNHQGNNNLLQWTTSNEVGTKTFVVESSANGNSFSTIGNVAASGGGKYSFVDTNPFAARTYYRLKIIDVDGKFTYSNIIWISTINNNNISVYPNPVGQITTLNINNNSQLIGTTAQLTDVGGRLLQQISINHNQEQLNMSALPTGLYLLKLKDGTVLKIMKNK